MGKFIDMTGWIMAEHGVPNSRLVVISRVDNYVSPKTGNQSARFLCECSCQEHNRIIAVGSDIRRGHTLSCGCLDRETTAAINKNKRNGNINGFCDDINYKWILLTNSNEKTYYDAENASVIEKYTWFLNNHGYAETNINGKGITMHQLLGYKNYDHQDRNKLNNIKKNFRQATKQENRRNAKVQNDNTSGITGVSWSKKKNKWVSYIYVNGKQKHLGYFENKKDAIYKRLKAEVKYFGEFAPQSHLFEKYNITYEG